MKADTPEAPAIRLQIGETLRQAREGLGWSVQDVASQLNLTRQILGVLEAGDFQDLPHTFARGYLRAYAKLLGLDPQRIALEFDRCTGTDATVGASVQQLSRIDEPVRGSQRLLRLVSVLLGLALLAAGFYWWQQHSPERFERSAIPEHIEVESADGTTQLHPLTEPELTEPEDAALAEMQGEAPQPPEDLSAELSASAALEEPLTSQPAAAPATVDTAAQAAPLQAPQPAEASAPALTPAPAPAPAVPVVPVAPVAPAAPSAPAPQASGDVAPTPVAPAEGEGLLEIAFSETCWIEITDGRGKVLHSALKRKGETLQLTGKMPLKLHLGFASAAQVRFNGQVVDVASYARGETARLILGQ